MALGRQTRSPASSATFCSKKFLGGSTKTTRSFSNRSACLCGTPRPRHGLIAGLWRMASEANFRWGSSPLIFVTIKGDLPVPLRQEIFQANFFHHFIRHSQLRGETRERFRRIQAHFCVDAAGTGGRIELAALGVR